MKTKITNSNFPRKRKLASLEGCKNDLEEDLPKLFQSFNEACQNYEREVVQTPPQARGRGFEASLLNSKTIASIQKNFPDYWKFGKYKRFILRINGYIILFKKLNKSGKPMNILTKHVSAISGQLSLPLFGNDYSIEEPILFFGYQKTKFGEIVDPKLVYIDEDKVKWTLSESDLNTDIPSIGIPVEPTSPTPVKPAIRESSVKRKVNN